MRQADEDFGLIQADDRIAVGVSGGKDSTLLLYAMKLYQYFCPQPFTFCGIMLDMGYPEFDPTPLTTFCEREDILLHVVPTDIKKVVFDIRQESHPCALCAKLRRGALYRTARFLGCNKVALGHHMDDALETFLLCMFYEGRLHTFSPKSYLDRANVTLIRPMIYLGEKHVIHMVNKKKLPVLHNPCPANGYTKPQDMKELITNLCKSNPKAREQMLGALKNVPQYDLWDDVYQGERPRRRSRGGHT